MSDEACLLPVENGVPGAADIGSARRMVWRTTTFADSDVPWIRALNRGGVWTIDAEGAYVPFSGPTLTDSLDVVAVTEIRTGRTVVAAAERLWLLDPPNDIWTSVPDTRVPRGWTGLLRVERLNLTLVMTPGQVRRLTGDRVVPWGEQAQVIRGGEALVQAFDMPGMNAALFLSDDGSLRLRKDNGVWTTLATLPRAPGGYRIDRMDKTERGRTALLLVRQNDEPAARWMAIEALPDQTFKLTDLGSPDRSRNASGNRYVYVSATDEILRFRQARPDSQPQWHRLTVSGFAAVAALAPERKGDLLFLHPTSVARSSTMVFATARGVVIYRAGRMQEVTEEDGPLGPLPQIIDLPSLGRTLIQSRWGLFELTDEARVVSMEAPFSTGGLPHILVYDDETNEQAVFIAKEGQFTLTKDGEFRRMRGSVPVTPSFVDERVLELPVSGDDLLLFDNALWLSVSPASPRWSRCITQAPGD